MPAALKVAIFNLLTELREYWTATPTPYAQGILFVALIGTTR